MSKTKKTDMLAFRGPEKMSNGKESVAHWKHRNARRRNYTSPHGRALRSMLEGWARYAETTLDLYESLIGQDGVLGDEWLAIGKSLIGLLCGDTGGWDPGSIDSNIRDCMLVNGFTEAEIEGVA
jgi:hypothetical protein